MKCMYYILQCIPAIQSIYHVYFGLHFILYQTVDTNKTHQGVLKIRKEGYFQQRTKCGT